MRYLFLFFALVSVKQIVFSQSLLGNEWFVNEIKIVTDDTILVADIDNSELIDLSGLVYNFVTDSTYSAVNIEGDTVYGIWSQLDNNEISIDNYLGTIDFINDDVSVLKRMFEYSDGTGGTNIGLSLIYLGKERLVSSTSEINKLIGVNIYPNPTNNFVDIEYSGLSSRPVKLNIYDNLGRMVLKLDNLQSNSNLRLNVSNFNKGQFFFQFIFVDGIMVEKVLIK
ncbi:T9SS type A sorting domain-containing protein [Neolewinella lacunae]|uniref:T9SS type A sorting domain-containing protein n=1 Tax=Neolewinella lacunae TaxID=1517758 RepID=A0A923PFN0_9BACT|nr:T9SS type A sorting domain-containing protein [Neolewinella lacunae]MBC6993210.1 T9SS type A sorting domain-containing protein [Neolewinella lacunae]MDN3634143.1 T9SS type A sorting domain-containing protein [Neolewinella lacunae]